MSKIFFIVFFFTRLYAQDSLKTETYEQSIDRWHEGRIMGLKNEYGWLSLIALEWMNEGENIVAGIGTISMINDSLRMKLNTGLRVMLNEKEFISGSIEADTERIIVGSKAIAIISRGGKYAVRVWDSETPARKNFTGIHRYPVDARWKITAQWILYDVPKKVKIPTVIPDLIQDGIVPGVAVFSIDGKECRLEPTIEEGSDELFFVFGDKTNGRESYGAGRFLYTGVSKDGTIILDFNKAYNPPCVFTDFATCPVPTPENRLKVRIEAGEKNFRSH